MRYIFFCVIFFTNFAAALDLQYCQYNAELKICKASLKDYHIHDNWTAFNKQFDEFDQKLKRAVLTDDYSSIYEYLQSPVTFYVEDFRDKKNGAILHHAWSAKSNEEFKVLFQKLVKAHKPIGIKNITMEKLYYPLDTIDLLNLIWIGVEPKCQHNLVHENLPEEIFLHSNIFKFCKDIKLTIAYISRNF